jgi:hypothetical protein
LVIRDRMHLSIIPLSMYPHYPYTPSLILPIFRDWALGRHRSFLRDAQSASALLGSQLLYAGLEQIPAEGPLLVTHNHYARPGFGEWWLVLAVAAALGRESHLLMTAELTRWFRPWGGAISRLALPRIAKMYGFTTMPPMPPRPQDVQARAASVRQVLEVTRHFPDAIVIVAPEGRDNLEGGSLAPPPPGAGRFLLLLASRGLKVVPVGGWEADAALNVRFGAAFTPAVPEGLDADARDQEATRLIMGRISALLPERLRGAYAHPEIAATHIEGSDAAR